MPSASGGNKIGISKTACHHSRSRVEHRAMYAATGVPTATMITIARLVSSSETRTDASAGPRTSSVHCHVPIRASSAENGYKSASANSAAPALAIQWRLIMHEAVRHLLVDRNYTCGRFLALHHLSTIRQKLPHPSRSARL